MRYNMKFIGVVMVATRQYVLEYLSRRKAATRDQHVSMVSKKDTGSMNLMALLQLDMGRVNFIISYSAAPAGDRICKPIWKKEGSLSRRREFEVVNPT